jgi:hypothetical protein
MHRTKEHCSEKDYVSQIIKNKITHEKKTGIALYGAARALAMDQAPFPAAANSSYGGVGFQFQVFMFNISRGGMREGATCSFLFSPYFE